MKNPKVKKPIYKKWWFWAIIAVVLITAVFGGGNSDASTEDNSTSVAVEQTNEAATETEEVAESEDPAEPTAEDTTESLSLPVKFGTVTSIAPLGNNAEMIILSMEDPSSSDGAERDVYIAAVDYLFSYAAENLESLGVFAFDPSGNQIIAFTMPNDLISALRKTEEEGNWGTEGFAAFFYFNQDAYDVLVESCVITEVTE